MKLEHIKGKKAFIFGFGVAGKWLSSNGGFEVLGFIDNNLKKNGQKFQGYKVFSPEQVQKIIEPDDLIINTVLDVQDVVAVIDANFPNNESIVVGEFFNDEKANKNYTEASDDFIEYSLKAVEMCHKSFSDKDRQFLHSVDVVISERCSLNCKDCSNLMQYYKSPKNLSYETVVSDFDNLMSKIRHVYEVRLIGGEPFMNKEIYPIIDYFINHPSITKIVIYTNATIPLKPDLMKNFSTPKVVFSITDYGSLSRNTQKVTDMLDCLNVSYRSLPPSNWTDSGRMHDFQRSEESMIDIFDRCCGKNLYTLMYGKLYRCPFSANAERLNGIPNDPNNSVKVDASIDHIDKYTNDIKYIPACNFCNGRSHDAPEITPAIQSKTKLEYKTYN
jgi:sulfatase maturation enzyme AslB (radical SAM superfamily)